MGRDGPMSIFEVIQRANAFVLATKGVQGEPDHVHLVRRPGKPRFWSVMYHFSLFYPDESHDGEGVDGGEYIVEVDDRSGEVSAFNLSQ
jgi:hypothetical protein